MSMLMKLDALLSMEDEKPSTYSKFMVSLEKQKWTVVLNKEMKSLNDNKTRELAELSQRQR